MIGNWMHLLVGGERIRRSLCCLALMLSGALTTDATAAQLQIPATHPRLFYANPARLSQTQTYLSTHALNPSGTSSTAMMQRALRGMLTGNTADCDQAVSFLVGWEAAAQGSGVRDALRQQGEDVLLIYDWCHHRLSAAQISTLVARWNGYMDAEFADDFANQGSEANNYWWGRTRNSLLWGIASFNDNARAQFFIDQSLDVRMGQDFPRWYQDFGRGGVFAEGTDYGVAMLAYPLIGFASAADFGHDAYANSPFFHEAIYALLYGTTPGATTTTGGSSGLPLVIPFNDDEHFFDGGVINVRDYLGDFAAFFGQRDPASGNARHMRTWLASTNAGRRWMFDAIRSTAAVDQSDLPLDYYAPGAGVFDMRSAHSADAMQVHLQLNTPGGIEHRHLDAGSFQLWRKGNWLSRESVGYSDMLAGLGGVGEVSSEAPIAHNTLMFEGKTTGMWIGSGPRVIPPGEDRQDNPDGLPQVLRLQHHPDFAYVAVDYSDAYRNRHGPRVDWPYADRVVREFLFLRSLQTLVILDRMRASSDSLLPFYQTEDWLNPGPHLSAEQVRRTFAMHFETNPTVNGARVTAVNGGQTTDLITLVPSAPTYRILNEDRPGDEQTGQFRLELDSVGTVESYFLQAIHGRDNGAPAVSATLTDNVDNWVIQLTGPNAQSATITLAKGMTSTGGSVAINGAAAQALSSTVQGISVNSDRPVWESSSTPTPQLSIADASIAEGNSGTKLLTFTVNLSAPAATAVTYDIATSDGTANAGTDYVASSLSGQSIAAGATSKTFSVTLNGDTAVEANETFAVTLSNAVGATVADGQATGTILNDDSNPAPSLSIADVSLTEGNSGTKLATFTVTLSAAATAPVTYNIATANGTATAGADYTARSLTGETIAAGASSRTFTVTITGDAAVEANETFLVNVSSVAGATVADGQATGTIVNDDSSSSNPSLSIADVSIAEGNSRTRQASFTVRLSAAKSTPVTYNIATANGTATAGSDYVASSLTGQSIPAGATSKVFRVKINGDRIAEANETFFVNVSNVVGATVGDGQAVGTITNDDAAARAATDARYIPSPADAISIGNFSAGGLFDDRNDGNGEPLHDIVAYARQLASNAEILCQRLGRPMIVGVTDIESRAVLADLAATASDQRGCAGRAGYQGVALDGDAGGSQGLLITTAEARPGVPRVEVLWITQLGQYAQRFKHRGRRDALYAQAPVAIGLQVNASDGSTMRLTVLLVRMAATDDQATRIAQANSLSTLIRKRGLADPSERLVVLGDLNARAVDNILVSPNLRSDYPALRLEMVGANADTGMDDHADASVPLHGADRDPQVLLLLRR
jgi:hypothetical protein